jgi:hypothetical protein
LEDREKLLSNLIRTHQAIYHALFRRGINSLCPIFNNALVKLCGIESKDIELLEKLQSLRNAIRQFKEDSVILGDKGRTRDKFEELTDFFRAIRLDKHHQSATILDNVVDADMVEDVDETQSISSTCSELSGPWGQDYGKSQAKDKGKATETSKLKEYWVARYMQEYDGWAWFYWSSLGL